MEPQQLYIHPAAMEPLMPSAASDELAGLTKAALLEGQIERGRVGEIVGLRGTAARQVIRLGLSEGLLDSTSEKGPLSLAFSSKTLESYFPKLYQDLPVDEQQHGATKL